MKSLFAFVLFSSFSIGLIAQQGTSQQATPKKVTAPAKVGDSYRCPADGYTSAKPGDCPKDKVTLVKVGDYYCPDCYMTATKAGKCSMCGVDMKKMEASTASNTKK